MPIIRILCLQLNRESLKRLNSLKIKRITISTMGIITRVHFSTCVEVENENFICDVIKYSNTHIKTTRRP